jgi:hypothetical protein
MFDPITLVVPVVNQPVICPKTVGVDDGIGVPASPLIIRCKLTYRVIFDDQGISIVSSFEHPENRCFAFGSTPTGTTHPSRSEVALTELDFAVGEPRPCLTMFGDTLTQFSENTYSLHLGSTLQIRRNFSSFILALNSTYYTNHQTIN